MLDEPTRALLDELAASDLKPLHEMTPAEVRALDASFCPRYGPGPALARVENATASQPDGARIPIRLFADVAGPSGGIKQRPHSLVQLWRTNQ